MGVCEHVLPVSVSMMTVSCSDTLYIYTVPICPALSTLKGHTKPERFMQGLYYNTLGRDLRRPELPHWWPCDSHTQRAAAVTVWDWMSGRSGVTPRRSASLTLSDELAGFEKGTQEKSPKTFRHLLIESWSSTVCRSNRLISCQWRQHLQ